MASDSLNVDLADVDDIRAKLPQAKRILQQKAHIALESVDDYQSFRELVTYLAKRVGVEPPRDQLAGTAATELSREGTPPPPQISSATVLDLVVEVVNRSIRQIRPRDVREILLSEGHTFESTDSVSNALNYAARRNLVKPVERGWYAPLAFQADESEDSLLTGTQSGGP